MTIREMAALLESESLTIKMESMVIECKALDMRQVWNRVDVLVTPINGSGEQWVSMDRVVQSNPVVVCH